MARAIVCFLLLVARLSSQDECGGLLTDLRGTISTPGYPNYYPNDQSCMWTIFAPPRHLLTLKFTSFSLESGYCEDSVTIYTIDATGNTTSVYCENNSPPDISGKTELHIKFKSDSSVTAPGFYAEYTTDSLDVKCTSDKDCSNNKVCYNTTCREHDSLECGGVITDVRGSIRSPGHPYNYPNSLRCVWEVVVPPHRHATLEFTTFQLESHDKCRFDFISIYTVTATGGTRFGPYCGDTLPANITGEGNLFIEFTSDISNSFSGFSAVFTRDAVEGECVSHNYCSNGTVCVNYKCQPANLECGGIITDLRGTIESPGFPKIFPTYQHCGWLFVAPPQRHVTLTFTSFSLEDHVNCVKGSVNIFSEKSSEFIPHGTYCGATLPPPITSEENKLFLMFSPSNNNSGFIVEFETDADDGECNTNKDCTDNQACINHTCEETGPSMCGGVITDLNGTITSPGYPSNYHNNLWCLWKIVAPSHLHVALNFTSFSLNSEILCAGDAVIVYSETSTQFLQHGRYCGDALPPHITSEENELHILFRSGNSNTYAGFSAEYYTDAVDG